MKRSWLSFQVEQQRFHVDQGIAVENHFHANQHAHLTISFHTKFPLYWRQYEYIFTKKEELLSCATISLLLAGLHFPSMYSSSSLHSYMFECRNISHS
jgi:hypothetical protein